MAHWWKKVINHTLDWTDCPFMTGKPMTAVSGVYLCVNYLGDTVVFKLPLRYQMYEDYILFKPTGRYQIHEDVY